MTTSAGLPAVRDSFDRYGPPRRYGWKATHF